MKRNKWIRSLAALILALLLATTNIVPAFAWEHSGNGYHNRTITFYGVTYLASLATSYSPQYGACTLAGCDAAVSVDIGSVSAQFVTYGYGIQSATGAPKSAAFSSTVHSISSYYASYSGGMSQVSTYLTIQGDATFHADVDYTLHAYAHNP